MATPMETPRPDDDSIRVERRADGAVVVRVKSSGADSERLLRTRGECERRHDAGTGDSGVRARSAGIRLFGAQ